MTNYYENLRGHALISKYTCWSCKDKYRKPGTLPAYCGICGREISERVSVTNQLLIENNKKENIL